MAAPTDTTFETCGWHRALELEERAVSLGLRPPTAGFDDEQARRRLARWKAQEPFHGDSLFARRLALAGLREDDLLALLGEPDAAGARRLEERPAWLSALADAFQGPAPDPFPVSPSGPEGGRLGLLNAVRPLMDAGWARLRAGVRDLAARHPGAPVDAETTPGLFAPQLCRRLFRTLSRALVLELNLAAREGRLAGETPEERFTAFVRELEDPASALAALAPYPVLARLAVETVERWVSFSLEFLAHLAADWKTLRAAGLSGREPGVLAAVEGGLGDSHRGGRSVQVAVFASGAKLVYKPRSLAVEAAFQDLLAWTEARGFAPAFRRLRIVDRGDHGWVEFVTAGPCASVAEVRRFYERQGGYLALLYALGATDIHYENLIAAGEHPVLVDLEALFHPWGEEIGVPPGEEPPGRPLQDSLLRIGLLPAESWGDAETAGVDLSGLAATAGQELPRPVLQLAEHGTDRMRFVRGKVVLPGAQNRPTLEGSEVPLTAYLDAIAQGLEGMLRLLLTERGALAAPDGPLAPFADAEVRVVLRPTQGYALLLQESLHPFFLGDALDRSRFLDHLWVAVETRPGLAELVPCENRDLARGDIPYFTTRPGCRDLWASDGRRFPDLLPASGLDSTRELLGRLDSGEIARQVWLLRNSFGAREIGRRPPLRSVAPESDRELEAGELLEAAARVGHRLESLAFRDGREAHWLGPALQGPRSWSLQPAGPDLYFGLPGIVLFLAQLGALTGEERFSRLARLGVTSLRRQLRLGGERIDTPGGFSGWGGIVWSLAHLGARWGDEELLDEAEAGIPRLLARLPDDTSLDLVSGAAGAIAGLLGLHAVRPASAALDAARRCGEHLLAHRRPMARGVGWAMPLAGAVPLAGFSHGAAGTAWALLRLEAATGEERFRAAALEGLAYERSLYSPVERNWPDLREGHPDDGAEAGRPHFMTAWCHGAAGIALGRLASLPLLDDAEARREIAIAVETTVELGFGRTHSLCHGDLGNLEVVLRAADALERPDLRRRAGRIAAGALATLRERGPMFGLPGVIEPPGLMIGLAGIGYGLLRLAEPANVPSVLTLDPIAYDSTLRTGVAPHGFFTGDQR
jgi:type 2 lantibiotic biosynthesis protein LanM